MVVIPIKPTKQTQMHLIYMHKEDLALNDLQQLICHSPMEWETEVQSQVES